MRDQADKLRQIIDNINVEQNIHVEQVQSNTRKSAKVITVTSGKGGVGKTNVTINLAVALSEMGLKVIILDADFGLANIDILFGLIPKFTLVDVINNRKSILDIMEYGPNKIRFISGGSGVEELVKLDKKQLNRFIENLSILDKLADVVIIDTGAGLSDNVMSFVMAADEVILVATPEPTSITDAYALIKMISNRNNGKKIRLLVNRAENITEAKDIINKLSAVSEKFLAVKLDSLGFILQDETVIKAVKLQQPFTICFPKSQASKYVRDISRKLIEVDTNEAQEVNVGVRSFVSRLVQFFSS